MKNLGYSTAGFKDRGIISALEAIAGAGFEYAEILGQEPHIAVPPRGKKLSELKKRLEFLALNVNLHAPLGKNVIGALDEQWRRITEKTLSNYICLAGDIGAKEIIVHSVPNPIFVPKPDDPALPLRMIDSARRSLDKLLPVAQDVKVRILLENLPYLCSYTLQTMKELSRFIKPYPAEYVGLAIDTGHAKVRQDDPAGEILLAGGRLCGTHLHDNDGTDDLHWMPTQGTVDWSSVLNALAEVNYAGVLTFEATCGRFGENPEELAEKSNKLGKHWIAMLESMPEVKLSCVKP